MTRKLNAQFLAIMAAQAAAATKVTPSLEADATTDPTEGNAPDTTEHDKAAEDAHAEAAAAPPMRLLLPWPIRLRLPRPTLLRPPMPPLTLPLRRLPIRLLTLPPVPTRLRVTPRSSRLRP
jgi:hypothetical protein